MQEVNVNFTYDGADYNVSFTPRESYYIHPLKIGDKEFSIRVSFTNNYITVYKTNDDPFAVDEQIYNQKLKKNKVLASKFLEWYISNEHDLQMLGLQVIKSLFDIGTSKISVVEMFKNCGYIPFDICEYRNEGREECNEWGEYDTSDILFEDDLTKTELTDHQKMYYYADI
jgi:hypothetical protein